MRGAILLLEMGRLLAEDCLLARHSMGTVALLGGLSFSAKNTLMEDSRGSGIFVDANFQGTIELDKVSITNNKRYGIESRRSQDHLLKDAPGVRFAENEKGDVGWPDGNFQKVSL